MKLSGWVAWVYLLGALIFGVVFDRPLFEIDLIRAGFFMLMVASVASTLGHKAQFSSQVAVSGAALFVLASSPPGHTGLAAAGAGACAAASIAFSVASARSNKAIALAFVAVAFGFSLDVGQALLGGQSAAAITSTASRMMRLAQVSAVALPLLLVFATKVTEAVDRPFRFTKLAIPLVLTGALLMPVILTLSVHVSMTLKYLLPVPADAVTIGTVMVAAIAFRSGRSAEAGGFAIVGASMVLGLLMGGYAFDGPLPSPVGGYGETARVLLRHGHVMAILGGTSLIALSQVFAARRAELARLALTFEGADLDRLNRGSLSKSFTPETDIDWSSATSDEEFDQLYQVWSLLVGSGRDASFGSADRVLFSKCQQINLMRFTALLERHGIAGIAKLYDAEGSSALTEYVGHFIKEETYHYTMFIRAIAQIEATLGDLSSPPFRGFELALKSLFKLVGWIPSTKLQLVMTFTIFRFAEQVTMYAHDMVRKTLPSRDGLVAQVWARHAIDEARHLKFDDMVIERLRAEGSRLPERLALPGCVLMSLFLNANEIWVARRLGAPVRLWHLPWLMKSTTAPFKRRVFTLVQKIARGPVPLEVEAGADA